MNTFVFLISILLSANLFASNAGSKIVQEGVCDPAVVTNPVVVEGPFPYCILKTRCLWEGDYYKTNTPCPVMQNGMCNTNVKKCDLEGKGKIVVKNLQPTFIMDSDPDVAKGDIKENPFETYQLAYVKEEPENPASKKWKLQCIGRIDSDSMDPSTYKFPFAVCNAVTKDNTNKCPDPIDCFAKRKEVPIQTPPYSGTASVHAGEQKVHKR